MTWNLADAQDRLPEVVNLALTEGPQTITLEQGAVVIVSAEKRAEPTREPRSFKDFLMSGPSLEGLDLERDRGPGRDVAL